MSTSRHRQFEQWLLERPRPVLRLGQFSQSGINEPSFLSGPSELHPGPQRSTPPAPINFEAGSSRRARRTQLMDIESGEFALPKFNFDLNELPPADYNELEGGPSNTPLMLVAPVEVGQPANIHPVEPSLQTQGSPPHELIDVVVILDSSDDDENEDDDDEDDDNEDYDDDGDDQYSEDSYDHGYNAEDVAAGDDDVIISSPIAFGQASSSRTSQGRASLINSESLQIGDNHQRNQRRRIDSQPPVNIRDNVHLVGTQSSMLQAPPPPPPRPPTYTCPICLCPMVEETTTKCGHIFCNGCVKTAMSAQGRCPICRQVITPRGLRRIYFSDPL